MPTRFRTEDQRWEAVASRDESAAAAFRYGVTTTGVYCRPGCSSRRPHRDNVRFFDTAEEAERKGFRPCQRCAPERDEPAQPHRDAVLQACRALAEDPSRHRLADLAAAAGLGPTHFRRVFRNLVGVTPKEYATGHRLARLQERLTAGVAVTEALYGAGFGSSSRLYEEADALLGMTPSRYRDGGGGAEVRFAVRPCSLGWVLVAATEAGVCALQLGDAPEALAGELRARFPRAHLAEGDAGFAQWVEAAVATVEEPGPRSDLPLDVRGTAFQRRVWRALREIPPGTRATYSQVAAGLGQPSAARAVARACATNPVAVLIPCHRVVAADGGLAGYRWGVARKQALLDLEAHAAKRSRDP
jgi:AraC family transcriptional regulator of adaptative response/methylated-DNA-[protein]-cysteine methyltransferase